MRAPWIPPALAVGVMSIVVELAYRVLIAPRFGSVTHVPWFVWGALYAPVLAACIGTSRALSSMRDVLLTAVACGLATELVKLAIGATMGAAPSTSGIPVRLARITFGYLVIFAVIVVIRRRRAR